MLHWITSSIAHLQKYNWVLYTQSTHGPHTIRESNTHPERGASSNYTRRQESTVERDSNKFRNQKIIIVTILIATYIIY